MNIVNEFISAYALNIVYAIVTAVMGYIGLAVKRLIEKYINDKTKMNVARTCVKAIEQIYVDLHGDEKLDACIASMSEMLAEKGIIVSEIEIRMLIEAAVAEMNLQLKAPDAE